MEVTLEVLPWLSELADGGIARKLILREVMPEEASLRGALTWIVERYPRLGRMVFDAESGRLTGHAEVAVNGVLYDQAGGLDAPLNPGDTITFLPGVAGGSDE